MPQVAHCTDEKDYYTHSEYCTIDPVESAKQGHDVYVLPTNGYIDAPVIAEGCVVRRVNDAWVNVENHIGEKGYVNGVPTEIKEYGPLPDGWSNSPPEPTAREKLLAEIVRLEAQQTTRRIREAALTDEGKSWLQSLESAIAVKRAELQALG